MKKVLRGYAKNQSKVTTEKCPKGVFNASQAGSNFFIFGGNMKRTRKFLRTTLFIIKIQPAFKKMGFKKIPFAVIRKILADMEKVAPVKGLAILLVALICFTGKVQAQELINMNYICKIESSGIASAVNANEGSVGLFQISPICLKEYNRLTNHKYTTISLFNPSINKQIASWFLNQRIPQMLRTYGLPVNQKNIIWAYNAGIGNVKKNRLPRITKKYLAKYERLKKAGK